MLIVARMLGRKDETLDEKRIKVDAKDRADIRIITILQARELRRSVLRPNQPPEATIFLGDDDCDALHLGAFEQGQLVGIVTILHQAPKEFEGKHPDKLWLLRGMATVSQVRGQGYGAALVRVGCAYVAHKQGTYLWCEGRESALGFYLKMGFNIRGDRFDVPTTGPHYRLWREINAADSDYFPFGSH